MIKKIFALLVCFLGFMGLPQLSVGQDKSLLEERTTILNRIQKEANRFVLNSVERKRLSEQHRFPLALSLAHQRTAVFQYMDGAGQPVYYTTYNVNAAKTTGASSMQLGGEFDLDLRGRGMVVGIYDQTRPKANHREFGNRVTQIDGSTEILSNHATHVTGTILAAGINSNARGMANEATGWAFNWDGDISKMIQNGYDPDLRPGGHLISNHSYGNLVGWYQHANGNWAWAGNESINNREDYRFGFYTSKSQQIDDLAFAKPYYTIVWAAGNDRSDVGDGSKNPDGPEDSIGPEGVPKNNITIGAVNEVINYQGPDDVVMSSFSSWGPTDDGRIKPDFVAMGVNVFSTSITDAQMDSYTSMSGTSMAAPNATGSLFLLQELFHSRNAGNYMRSATLKALAIHTTKEAGTSPGPDYRFGWGLLDVKAAAELILNENGSSDLIRELVLENNQIFEHEFISDGIRPIKVTIAWTDPAGNPPAPSLNPADLMLVNDLDLRIIDEDGKEYFPWSLNPREGATSRAMNDRDNFRDNVEQVIIEAPEAKKYTLRISHKGNLKNNLQAFSLILSTGVSDGQDNTLYWIGGDGNWNSPDNWSLESNGISAGLVPDGGTRVVFDQSASSASQVALSADTEVFSLNVFGDLPVEMELGTHTLSIKSGLRISNPITSIRNGKMEFNSESSSGNIIDLGASVMENVEMEVQSGQWRIVSAGVLDKLLIVNATVELDVLDFQVNELRLESASTISGSVRNVSFKENIFIGQGASLNVSPAFRFIGSKGWFNDLTRTEDLSLIVEGDQLQLQNAGQLKDLMISKGELLLEQALTIAKALTLKQGVVLNLMEKNQIQVIDTIAHQSSTGNPSLIKSKSKGIFRHDPYKKYCLENISVQNVDLSGEAVISLGAGAETSNSANWLKVDCPQVLFVNFEVNYGCEGALVEFINTTEGPATRYEWNFGSLGTSNNTHPSLVFPREGTYQIRLTAIRGNNSMTYEKDVVIQSNPLKEPSIVTNGTILTSLVPAAMYQWYKNGQKIEGAVERSYQAEEEGAYQVAVVAESCNRISEAVVISGMPDQLPLTNYGYVIGPNPAADRLKISIDNEYIGEVVLEFYGMNAALLETVAFEKNQRELSREIRLDFQPGLYVLLVKTGDLVLPYRLIKQ
jgi:hypothetical protein